MMVWTDAAKAGILERTEAAIADLKGTTRLHKTAFRIH
jgi:hypothetical protein